MIARHFATLLLAAAAAGTLAGAPLGAARAQSGPGWFVPPSGQAAPEQAPAKRGRRAAPAPAPVAAPLPPSAATAPDVSDEVAQAEAERKAQNLPRPPAPPLPDIVSTLYSAIASGDAAKVSAIGIGAALPAPLAADTTYYLIKGATNQVQLSTRAGGSPIAFEGAGTGTLRLTVPTAHTGQTNLAADFTVQMPGTLKLLAGGTTPPSAAIGVLGVPDVMRLSSAAQAVDKVVGARKERLQLEVARAQANWRQMEQALQADAPKLTREQLLARERAFRAQVGSDRRALQEKNRMIQEAAQIPLGQIERTLIGVIRQVAEARGMNLVLHRSQVALNVQEYDITEAVAAQLNRALPTVQIPPDNVDPATLPKDWGTPPAQAAAATR